MMRSSRQDIGLAIPSRPVKLGRASRGLLFACASVLAMTAGGAMAQQLFAYPNEGQSAEQQALDSRECGQWSISQTGYDPSRPPPPPMTVAPPPPPPVQQGGILRGAGRGAALGAVGGAIAGNAGRGAAIGAATGALFGGFRRVDAQREQADWQAYQQAQVQQQQQQYAQQQAQGQQNYNRAFSACMSGRGYTVQ